MKPDRLNHHRRVVSQTGRILLVMFLGLLGLGAVQAYAWDSKAGTGSLESARLLSWAGDQQTRAVALREVYKDLEESLLLIKDLQQRGPEDMVLQAEGYLKHLKCLLED